MKIRSRFPGFLFWAFFACGIVFTATPALATTTNSWTNTVSSLWRATTNWSSSALPSTSFDFITIANAGTKTVTLDALTPAANLSVRGLVVSAPSGSTNTLQIINVPSGTPFTSSRAVSIDSGGVIVITNSVFSPQSTFDVSAGILQMDGGSLDTTGGSVDIRVGRVNGASGNVLLNGGTIKCFGFRLGELGGSQGNCTINGGTLLSSSVVDVGELLNAPGTLTLLSGQVIATNDVMRVGNLGSGTFNHSGGSSSLSFLSIADNAPGIANISGGLMTVTPAGLLDVTRVGNFGTGQFNISGGTVWLRGEFHVADNPGIIGSVLVTGGQLISTNDLVAIGRYGIGDFTITNATAWFTNTSVGRHDGATGTLTVQDKASLFCVDDMSIGRFANSVGHAYVSGGLLSLTNDNIWTGREGSGDLNVSGGTVRAKALYVGMSEYGTNTPQGTATLTGGATILSSNLIVGTSLLSTGQVNVAGGLLAVTNQTANNAMRIASGTFSLIQGVVITDRLLLTNATGSFSFAGGELRAGSITVSNGAPFVVGDGVHPATLRLGGGTFSFADGLIINSNATVTGCGTILGPISNNGTLSTNCGGGIIIGSIRKVAATATIFFSTVNGASHVLEFKIALNDPTWNPILPGIVGNGSIMSLQDTTATNAVRYYRIHVQ